MGVEVRFSYKRVNCAMWLAFTLSSISCIVMFYEVMGSVSLELKIANALFFINYSFISIYLSASASVLVCIYDISKTCNEHFQKLHNDRKFSKTRNFSRIFMKTSDLCCSFSNVYALSNLNFAFASFLFVSIENYCIFAFFKTPNLLNFKLIVNVSLWVVSLSIYSVTLMTFSELINRQGHRTMHILEQISPSECSDKEFKRISIFIQQISHDTLGIYCGVFKLNMNFLFDFFVSIFSITLMFFQLYGMNK